MDNIYILLYYKKQHVQEVHLKHMLCIIGDKPKSHGANKTSSYMVNWQELTFVILIQFFLAKVLLLTLITTYET